MVIKAILSATLYDKKKEKTTGDSAADYCYRLEVEK
jgi:hypothetical protein